MSRPILASLSLILTITSSLSAAVAGTTAAQRPLWERYTSQGYKAMKDGDPENAKKYFLGALTELEKTPPKPHTPLNAFSSRLEKGLLEAYPREWTIDQNNPAKQMALQEEQVNVLGRLARISQNYDAPMDVSKVMITQSYQRAVSDLQKTKDAVSRKEASKSDSTH